MAIVVVVIVVVTVWWLDGYSLVYWLTDPVPWRLQDWPVSACSGTVVTRACTSSGRGGRASASLDSVTSSRASSLRWRCGKQTNPRSSSTHGSCECTCNLEIIPSGPFFCAEMKIQIIFYRMIIVNEDNKYLVSNWIKTSAIHAGSHQDKSFI